MVLVFFAITSADHDFRSGQWSLHYQVQLFRNDFIELSTGEWEKFRNGEFTVFPDTDESNNQDRKAIGSIKYYPAFDDDLSGNRTPCAYAVKVLAPKPTFDELLADARMGRLPSRIGIEVEGMEYGGAPDGSHKKWDNEASPQLDVTLFDIGIPLAQTKSDKSPPSDDDVPPTRSQFSELSEKLDRLNNRLGSLLWAVLVIGVLALLLRVLT